MTIEVGREYLVYVKEPGKRKAFPLARNGITTKRIHATHYHIDSEGKRNRFSDWLERLRADNPDCTFEPRAVPIGKGLFC